ncbi:MAG: ParA family protein [Terricaulis sp.]
MAQTIAVANMKGGVGKTTLSAMLAEGLAQRGAQVLLVDLDAQGSLSFALMGSERFEEAVRTNQTVSRYFAERASPNARPLEAFITPAASLLSSCKSLDLVAAEPKLQLVERTFIGDIAKFGIGNPLKGPETAASKWIKRELSKLPSKYEFIIFDCPPGISIFAFAGIQNSTKVIIPATPDYLSLLAVQSMQEYTLPAALKGRNKKHPLDVRIILNRCAGTSKLPKTYRGKLLKYIKERQWAANLATFQIPQSVRIQRAMEASEERTWTRFSEKYDTADIDLLLADLID